MVHDISCCILLLMISDRLYDILGTLRYLHSQPIYRVRRYLCYSRMYNIMPIWSCSITVSVLDSTGICYCRCNAPPCHQVSQSATGVGTNHNNEYYECPLHRRRDVLHRTSLRLFTPRMLNSLLDCALTANRRLSCREFWYTIAQSQLFILSDSFGLPRPA